MKLVWKDDVLPRPLKWAAAFALLFLCAAPIPHSIAVRQIGLNLAVVIVVFFSGRKALSELFSALPLKAVFLAWLALALLSIAWAVEPAYAAREVKNEVLYPFLAFFVFFAVSRGGQQLQLFYVCALSVLLGAALSSGWARLATGEATAPAYLFNGIGSYSTFLIALLPFGILVWVRAGTLMRVALLAAFVFMLAPLWYANTRTVWVAATVTMITLLMLVAARASTLGFRRRAAIGLIAVVVAMPMIFVNVLGKRQGMETRSLSDIAETTASGDPRPALWRLTVSKIGERPWTGYGYGTRALAIAFPEIPQANGELWHAHNVVLNFGIQLGLPGVVLVLTIFGAIVWRFWRIYRDRTDNAFTWLGAAGIALVVGVFTKNMTDVFFYRENALIFWALVGSVMGYYHYSRRAAPQAGSRAA